MPPPSAERAGIVEWSVAALCVLFAASFAFADIRFIHPGAAWPDEILTNLQWPQQWREGLPLPLSFFKGCLHRDALALCGAWGPPSLLRLHLPMLAAFLAENAALYFLGRRIFSEPAALWAMALNAVAAFTLLRLRSLLSYSVLPAELLLMLALAPQDGGFLASLLWGLAAALLLLEYEAWALALAVLALASFAQRRRAGPAPLTGPALAGLALGLAAVLALSWPELQDYMALRSSQSLGGTAQDLAGLILRNLRGYWLGGPALPYTGVRGWPAFPFFAWPALALGAALAWRRSGWVLAWVLIGFVPLISLNSASEPQRMIVAWPALCLLGGEGFAFLGRRWRASLGLLAALLCLGAWLEASAYSRSMDAAYASSYGFSANLSAAAKILAGEAKPLRLITELDCESAAAERFLLEEGGLNSAAAGGVVAVVPWDYAGGLDGQGSLQAVSSVAGARPVILCRPGPRLQARLEKIESDLGPLWLSLPRFQARAQRRLTLDWLLGHPGCDAWERSACFEQILGQSFMLGEMPGDVVALVEKQPLQSVSGLVWSAQKLQVRDPAWAARLAGRAFAIDPRRQDARAMMGQAPGAAP
jgi:hypothetical protein